MKALVFIYTLAIILGIVFFLYANSVIDDNLKIMQSTHSTWGT